MYLASKIMAPYEKPKQEKAEYVRRKADEIQAALVKGCTLSYHPSVPCTTDCDKEFHSNYTAIAMELKDRGFVVWGKVYPMPGEWNITF